MISDHHVLDTLQAFATNKKSGYERESAAIAYKSFADVLGPPIAPLLLPSFTVLYDLLMDKGDVVRSAASSAIKAIIKSFPPEATPVVYRALEDVVRDGKWKSKVGAMDSIKSFVSIAPDFVGEELVNVLPVIEGAMHDTKAEVRASHPLVESFAYRSIFQVSSAAIKCATSLCTTVANEDLSPHIAILVKCMVNPDAVAACIKSLSSTTFVREVKAPALAVLVPLLTRALNDRSMEVQRRTVVVVENLVKLVRDPHVAAVYLSSLVEGVQKIATGAAFPEVRLLVAHDQLCLT